jgi:hypothetical protein
MIESLQARIRRLRALAGTSEVALWPTCVHCMNASALSPGGERWVPVEGYRIDPPAFRPFSFVGAAGAGRDPVTGLLLRKKREGTAIDPSALNRPRKKETWGWFSVVAQCHGREASAEIDIPRAWGVHHVFAAIQRLAFFGLANERPEHGLRVVYGGRA